MKILLLFLVLANTAFAQALDVDNALLTKSQFRAKLQSESTAKRVLMIIFENTDAKKAMNQPFFKRVAAMGAYFQSSYGVARPSQPNYLALITGKTFGVHSDGPQSINAPHLGDLIEGSGLDWRVYAEGYPEESTQKNECFTGSFKGPYARKHVPFLSFKNVNTNPKRCSSHIFSDKKFEADIAAGDLPLFSLFIPDDDSNGHDTGVAHAAAWFEQRFGTLFLNEEYMRDTFVIVTFDESSYTGLQHIYTAMLGGGIEPGTRVTEKTTHYDVYDILEQVLAWCGIVDSKSSAR